jgi:hypothetical protein
MWLAGKRPYCPRISNSRFNDSVSEHLHADLPKQTP